MVNASKFTFYYDVSEFLLNVPVKSVKDNSYLHVTDIIILYCYFKIHSHYFTHTLSNTTFSHAYIFVHMYIGIIFTLYLCTYKYMTIRS